MIEYSSFGLKKNENEQLCESQKDLPQYDWLKVSPTATTCKSFLELVELPKSQFAAISDIGFSTSSTSSLR